jgi:hypothetical protein
MSFDAKEFEVLVSRVLATYDRYENGSHEYPWAAYEPVLDYIVVRPEAKRDFIDFFCAVIEANCEVELVAFCMKVLRWEAVRDAALQKQNTIGPWSYVPWHHVIEAWDDESIPPYILPVLYTVEMPLSDNYAAVSCFKIFSLLRGAAPSTADAPPSAGNATDI